ncbi:MAG TPA: GNAT family N-acetyltransferase [Nitrososphaerales archaeon]|jgi:ribosomal protein S18 acetylase RimI-like enzyme|nr:GNAT family N-acetyltransferase [Nitrososphaerales archaeon]|tara:strand:+ start:12583 stop:13350 length:768 start_codon:yes stop_codon:yes gene_type:complete
MDSLNKIKQFEENENTWFSFFSDFQDMGYAQILMNEKLANDILYNHATSINCSSQEATEVLHRIASRFRRKRIAQCFFFTPLTSPSGFKEILGDNGFKDWDYLHVMEYTGLDTNLQKNSILVKRVGMESMKKWVRIFSNSFDIPLSQVQEYTVRTRVLFPRSDIDFYIAYVQGKAVGCAALYSKNNVGGIYALGILKEFRDQGVASDMINAIVKRSKERKNDSLILQFLMRDNLEIFYRENGFEKIYSKTIYLLK